jgi:3-methylcrotonyl-CoA carboxylase alpha subunit
MFTKILIANRGEIACRVIKTAKKLGIQTVAIYSDADASALHVELADEAIHVGGSAPADSYLQKERILAAASLTGAQAIHPGYGFLSENAEFAALCLQRNIVFIGPPVEAIKAMGSKSAAKHIMQNAGVPVLSGYHGDDQTIEVLKKAADAVGYPVLLKAAAGGGGKGMRQVHSAEEFDEGLAAAKREAKSSFGDDIMLVEKYLLDPRHVEVQVFCDQKGNGVYLFERDCSVQRRHQKIIEEAPAPGMTQALRSKMGEAAVTAALAINYVGAGTVEFLLSEDGTFYFMEMNTRLQVEHPVTEMITNQDLVEWQLRVADGQKLPLAQNELQIRGHAFEARIYAEDPANEFLPAAGSLNLLQTPQQSEHVRVDSGVRQGDDIGVFYDPMIAKLVVWDEDRERALQRLNLALASYRVRGVTTNIDFLISLSSHNAFVDGLVHTGFIEQHREKLFEKPDINIDNFFAMAMCFLVLQNSIAISGNEIITSKDDPANPWLSGDNWRLNGPNAHSRTVIYQGEEYPLVAVEIGDGGTRKFRVETPNTNLDVSAALNQDKLIVELNGHKFSASVYQNGDDISFFTNDATFDFRVSPLFDSDDSADDVHGGFVAPMNGTIVEILAASGQSVEAGTTLIIMEAMKMEHAMHAPSDGVVGEIFYGVGDLVEGGMLLLDFEQQQST